jgi:hypothetical protein
MKATPIVSGLCAQQPDRSQRRLAGSAQAPDPGDMIAFPLDDAQVVIDVHDHGAGRAMRNLLVVVELTR